MFQLFFHPTCCLSFQWNSLLCMPSTGFHANAWNSSTIQHFFEPFAGLMEAHVFLHCARASICHISSKWFNLNYVELDVLGPLILALISSVDNFFFLISFVIKSSGFIVKEILIQLRYLLIFHHNSRRM